MMFIDNALRQSKYALRVLTQTRTFSMNLLNPSGEGFSEHKGFVFGGAGLEEQRQWH
jgi:uncharacterized protein YjbK